jgi:radical SAM protein with 4Fe4S-binding SPASM domain
MKSKINLTKDDIERGQFELIKEDNSGHGIYVEKSLIEQKHLDNAIYRYMKLSFLLNMLEPPQKFYVANRQLFSDLRDKMGIVKRLEEIRNVYSEAESWKNRKRLRERRAKQEIAWQQCISCWCLDVRKSGCTDENFLMWKAYSSNEITVRIGSSIRHFIDSILKIEHDIFIAKVDYKNKYSTEIFDIIFRKYPYYEDEQELRMLVLSDNPKGLLIPVDLNILIDEVRVSPFVPPNLEKFIMNQLGEQYPQLKQKIQPSMIMEYVK